MEDRQEVNAPRGFGYNSSTSGDVFGHERHRPAKRVLFAVLLLFAASLTYIELYLRFA